MYVMDLFGPTSLVLIGFLCLLASPVVEDKESRQAGDLRPIRMVPADYREGSYFTIHGY
jgi:hypothetical protein